MSRMRKLHDDYKTTFRGLEEVEDAVESVIYRVRKSKIRVLTFTDQPRKPGKQEILCALCLWANELPEDELRRSIGMGMKILDRYLSMDEPAPMEGHPELEFEPDAKPPASRKKKNNSN